MIARANNTFVAYIDESGDEGFEFDEGSSLWFVLSAAIFRAADEIGEVKLVDDVRDRINQGRKPEHRLPVGKALHFRDLKHEQRKFFVHRIAQASVRIVSILISKPDLTSPENFTLESRLYFFAVRLLVERISWYCRDHMRKTDSGDGSVDLVFSNRATMDYESLREYLERLELNRDYFDYKAAANVVRSTQVATYTHGRRMGLQIADAIASSFLYAVQPSPYGLTEDGYARLLLPCIYRHQKKLWGYGVKLFPSKVEELRRQGKVFESWER